MDKSTNFWKLTTIALLFLVVFSVAFYSFEFNHISKNRGFKETIAQEKHSPESIIPINQKEEIRTKVKPDYSWIPSYFNTIDKRTEVAQIPKLRSVSLPEDDVEIRFWFDIGYFLLEGFVLKRNSGKWSAVYLEGTEESVSKIQYQKNRNEYQKELAEPKSGWDTNWKDIVDKGVLTLPDATEINCNETGWADGFSLIVEYKVNLSYRTYKYDDPKVNTKCSEAQQISEIFRIIKDEFRFIENKL